MEPTEKFLRRNLGVSGPEDYIKLYDGTIVPMSESGEQFAYSERITECNVFCIGAFLGAIKASIVSNQIAKTVSAKKVNNWFIKKLGYDPPYKDGTKVTTYKLDKNTKFVRVYDGESSMMKGSFLMKPEDIEGLTAKQIQEKYALPNLPKFICDVELKKGDFVRTGITNPLFGFEGGGIQFDTYENIDYVGIFSNERILQ